MSDDIEEWLDNYLNVTGVTTLRQPFVWVDGSPAVAAAVVKWLDRFDILIANYGIDPEAPPLNIIYARDDLGNVYRTAGGVSAGAFGTQRATHLLSYEPGLADDATTLDLFSWPLSLAPGDGPGDADPFVTLALHDAQA